MAGRGPGLLRVYAVGTALYVLLTLPGFLIAAGRWRQLPLTFPKLPERDGTVSVASPRPLRVTQVRVDGGEWLDAGGPAPWRRLALVAPGPTISYRAGGEI